MTFGHTTPRLAALITYGDDLRAIHPDDVVIWVTEGSAARRGKG
jgi:hypothetical protein